MVGSSNLWSQLWGSVFSAAGACGRGANPDCLQSRTGAGSPVSHWTPKIHAAPPSPPSVGLFSSLRGLLRSSPVPPGICGPQLQNTTGGRVF